MGNVTGSVAAKFAFFPPDPPTCNVYSEQDRRLIFSGVTADKNVDVHLLDTKAGNKIVATFWKHPFARFTLLYSHGNAADLGQMQELFIVLRAYLCVNVMSYDYLGYGASSGKVAEELDQAGFISYPRTKLIAFLQGLIYMWVTFCLLSKHV